ncbi:MAG: ABC transporter permease, partial [Bacteroidales bacterium]|nr:ABC transporter permease [Bacteroidales bacterium]
MKQIFIIIKREYLQVVRKKSFVIMTILGPIILAALCIVPTLLAIYGNDTTTIAVLDESGIFQRLNSANDKDIRYEYVHDNLDNLKQQLIEKKYNAILYIPDDPISIGGMVYSHSSLNTGVMSNILSAMKTNFTDIILISDFHIAKDSLDRYINQHTGQIT